ncbi:hypothetical protein GCM10007920_21730 [Ciceribacter naphthalenivorans]|uniref:Uncharacterized protein n=2 Tax=Alphaproteobacteria TaxID=28211 RepID=A0A512HG40_9HYPH|nr:hypothetical protein RNA01_13550 [Ciceribacter naphthalenivorans]GLR22386.1 hypothetical protein GCM10007920_21730 [Ciceribacter naphthalenivorans]GLT05242.1 hypothetical protein GCM10007926_21730 [Sphingomonas psychrolutea]
MRALIGQRLGDAEAKAPRRGEHKRALSRNSKIHVNSFPVPVSAAGGVGQGYRAAIGFGKGKHRKKSRIKGLVRLV